MSEPRKFSTSFQSPNIQLILINNGKTINGYRKLIRALIQQEKEIQPKPNPLINGLMIDDK